MYSNVSISLTFSLQAHYTFSFSVAKRQFNSSLFLSLLRAVSGLVLDRRGWREQPLLAPTTAAAVISRVVAAQLLAVAGERQPSSFPSHSRLALSPSAAVSDLNSVITIGELEDSALRLSSSLSRCNPPQFLLLPRSRWLQRRPVAVRSEKFLLRQIIAAELLCHRSIYLSSSPIDIPIHRHHLFFNKAISSLLNSSFLSSQLLRRSERSVVTVTVLRRRCLV